MNCSIQTIPVFRRSDIFPGKLQLREYDMDSTYLFAAFFWGTIGFGFFIYGKKQKSLAHLLGGIILMGTSYLVKTAVNLSLCGVAIIAGIYILRSRL